MTKIIKIVYLQYIASDGIQRSKFETFYTNKTSDYYEERLSSGEPELWEIVDINHNPIGVFILVPDREGGFMDGKDMLKTYLQNKYDKWDFGD